MLNRDSDGIDRTIRIRTVYRDEKGRFRHTGSLWAVRIERYQNGKLLDVMTEQDLKKLFKEK